MKKLVANGGIEIADGVQVIENHEDPRKCRKAKKCKQKSRKAISAGDIGPLPSWSPYGCHYYPDPEDFPDPNPDSLPQEPLDSGEQYFLDLAGNIKKVISVL